MITVGVIGNPNVGKTELFNRLTGSRAYVANFPGATVQKREGTAKVKGEEIKFIDLPGLYSLTAEATDQLIARNFIVEEKPDVVIDIVDGANLERNLYLTLLLIELEANLVVALNMWDVAQSRGDNIDVKMLSEMLGVPVVPTVATTGEGLDKLRDEIIKAAKEKEKKRKTTISYGDDVERWIKQLEEIIQKDERLSTRYPARWLAIKVLERDEVILKMMEESKLKDELFERLEKITSGG
jgi:ferrous iron transport protein B